MNPTNTLSAESNIDCLAVVEPHEPGAMGDDVSEYDGEPTPESETESAPDLLPGEDMDGDHASALASAGLGTDEDYYLDSAYEDRTEFCGE